jgi:hypothetical protein
MEYESVTQKVVLFAESILIYTFIFRKQFYIFVSGLKIIGQGNPDNNSDSHCFSIRM